MSCENIPIKLRNFQENVEVLFLTPPDPLDVIYLGPVNDTCKFLKFMEGKICFVFQCPYCFALLNKVDAGHRCPDDQAPLSAKRDPVAEFLWFLEQLRRSDYVFVVKARM